MESSKSQTLEWIYVPTLDTPKPELNKNYMRLYGHHLCPFVEKARMALAVKGVDY